MHNDFDFMKYEDQYPCISQEEAIRLHDIWVDFKYNNILDLDEDE